MNGVERKSKQGFEPGLIHTFVRGTLKAGVVMVNGEWDQDLGEGLRLGSWSRDESTKTSIQDFFFAPPKSKKQVWWFLHIFLSDIQILKH